MIGFLGYGLIGANNNAIRVPTLKTLKTSTIVHTFRDTVTIIVGMTWATIVTVTISVMVSRFPIVLASQCPLTSR